MAAKRRKKRPEKPAEELIEPSAPRKGREEQDRRSATKLLRSVLLLSLGVLGFGVFALFFWYPDVAGPAITSASSGRLSRASSRSRAASATPRQRPKSAT